jgi:predicted hydrocarbon binding protein
MPDPGVHLILSIFDELIGPKVFLALPEEVPSDAEQVVNSLMDFRMCNKYFEITTTVGDIRRKYSNYSFTLASNGCRGGNRICLLSAVFDRQLESVMIENKFAQFVQTLQMNPQLDLAFNYSDKTSEAIVKAYHQIKQLLQDLYVKLLQHMQRFTFVDRVFDQKPLSADPTPNDVTRSMASAFISAIDARIPEGAQLLFEVGGSIANKLQLVFQASDVDHLIEELNHFWRKNGFGEIDEVKVEAGKIDFKVYDCFECTHMPNIGQTVCRFDEGFLTKIAEIRLSGRFLVKELECYATGFDHCRFEIQPLI